MVFELLGPPLDEKTRRKKKQLHRDKQQQNKAVGRVDGSGGPRTMLSVWTVSSALVASLIARVQATGDIASSHRSPEAMSHCDLLGRCKL